MTELIKGKIYRFSSQASSWVTQERTIFNIQGIPGWIPIGQLPNNSLVLFLERRSVASLLSGVSDYWQMAEGWTKVIYMDIVGWVSFFEAELKETSEDEC